MKTIMHITFLILITFNSYSQLNAIYNTTCNSDNSERIPLVKCDTSTIKTNTVNLVRELNSKKTLDQDILFGRYNKYGALNDIVKGEMKLLLPGGIVSSPELPNDFAFEKKYNVTFLSRGCIRFSEDNEAAYNYEIFKYLDKAYGKDWRNEIREDVIGLEN